jgi:hypothetical protein
MLSCSVEGCTRQSKSPYRVKGALVCKMHAVQHANGKEFLCVVTHLTCPTCGNATLKMLAPLTLKDT